MNFILIFFLILFSGCASQYPKEGSQFTLDPSPSNDKALVYFYQRVEDRKGCAIIVYINDAEKGCLGNPGFTKIYIDPGKNKVKFTPNAPIKIANSSFIYEFKGGETYFFEYINIDSTFDKTKIMDSHYIMIYDYFRGWVVRSSEEAIPVLMQLKTWN